MGDTPRRLFGNLRCPECGTGVPATELLRGLHACDPDALEAHEAALLLEQIELMHFEVDEFLRSREARSRLAFVQWCREHGR
jgi:hypothetical protein